MVIANAWTVVSSVSALVAAAAALATIWFARRTVIESRAARREAHEAHTEEMGQQSALLAATTTAHEREMTERERALASQLVLQRLVQMVGHRTAG